MTLAQRLHRLRFFVSDAWDEWRHSPGINLLAVVTLASALFIAGLLVLIVSNVERRVQHLRDDVRVEVYLEDDIGAEARVALRSRLEAVEGVARVDFVDKLLALRRYREWAGNMAELIEELESNPLPASLEVFLQPGPSVESVGGGIVERFAGQPGVEEIRFNRGWLRRLESLLDLARVGGTGLAVVVFGAVMFVMASVLRLAVYARRDEIEIMLLVGATPAFVRGPFLAAGLAQGLISSGLALLTLEGVRRSVVRYGGSGSLALLDLVAAHPVPLHLSALLVVVGLVVSLAGSYLAVRLSV